MSSRPNAIDLFCGCGGMSLGAARAGFRLVGAIDFDAKALASHKRNFPHSVHYAADLAGMPGSQVLESLKVRAGEVEVCVGGPPCQGFSTMGKRNPGDERNLLLADFLRIVGEIGPSAFVLENVPALLHERHKKLLDAALLPLESSYDILDPQLLRQPTPGHQQCACACSWSGFENQSQQVGMKRALFKIGRYFEVESWTRGEHLRVAVDVNEWESEPEKDPTDWTFPLVVAEKNSSHVESGTHITAKRLPEYSVEQLSGSSFGTELMLTLKHAHTESLNAGLTITVNGQNVGAEVETLLLSEEIKPISYSETLQVSKKSVKVRLIAGVGEAKLAKAGWYIFCNGQQIEQAEKTEKTAWNTAIDEDHKTPKVHWQFRRFRGYLFFESDAQDALPWNTTKTGLNVEAPAYRRVRNEMLSAMRQVIDFLNQVDAESESEGDKPLTSALESAPSAALRDLPQNRNFFFKPSSNRPEKKMRISYAVSASIGEVVKESLGVSANKEVGEETFKYYVEAEGLE